jgi:hypothetical protein
MITKKHESKGGESNTQDSKREHNHAHKSQLELKIQRKEFFTQKELKSLSQRIECVRIESWSLSIFLVSLGDSSMRLGVPFIVPRQLGAVGDNLGRLILPSVGWRTGQSGAPPGSHCSMSGADLLPNLVQTIVATPGWLAHRTVCAPSRPLARATRRAKIARPTVALTSVGSPDSLVHHRTVR